MSFDHTLKKVQDAIIFVLKIICLFCFVLLGWIIIAGVVIRRFPFFSMHAYDEIQIWISASMIFFAATALWIKKDHFKIEFLREKFRGSVAEPYYELVIDLLCFIFIAIFTYASFYIVYRSHEWTNVLRIPMKLVYICLPIAGFIMLGSSVVSIIVTIKKMVYAKAK